MTPTEQQYNSLLWRDLSGGQAELSAALDGCRIIDAESTDYPVPDEINLYLQDNGGRLFALRAGVDPADPEARFYIQLAPMPDQHPAAG